MSGFEPTFEPCELKIGTGWYIKVTWPNGQAEQISDFKNEAEASDWINISSKGWLEKRTRLVPPISEHAWEKFESYLPRKDRDKK